jgi:hypothetical protein
VLHKSSTSSASNIRTVGWWLKLYRTIDGWRISDIRHETSAQCMRLWLAVTSVSHDTDGEPTASLGHGLLQTNNTLPSQRKFAAADCIWRSGAPLNCKIFMWLAVQYRLLTPDRRARHGLQDAVDAFYVCLQKEPRGISNHLLIHRVYARKVRFRVFQSHSSRQHLQSIQTSWEPWWLRSGALQQE